MRLKLAGRTEQGRVRATNEDAFYTWVSDGDPNRCLCIVADGMGGSNAGEIASQMAVSKITAELNEWLSQWSEPSSASSSADGDAAELLAQAVLAANSVVYEAGRGDPAKNGMGTTVTAALVLADRMSLVHVGDSRGLLLREGQLKQLTLDHSVVAELMRNGALTEQEAAIHPHRNILTRALGTERLLAVDIHEEAMSPGDIVILCSDGVTRHLDVADFERVVGAGRSPAATVDALIELALERGGLDNLTCIAIMCEECCPQ